VNDVDGSEVVLAAERVIDADIAAVYDAIAQVGRWSTWMSAVVGSVELVGPQAYDLSAARDGVTNNHRVVVKARGPVHSFIVELDARWLLDFRCTPHVHGTSVRVTGQRLTRPSWRERITAKRQIETTSARLTSMLDQLAAHLEHAGG
jgi:hypothetical protein